MKASVEYRQICLLLAAFVSPVCAVAHEFWIEPLRFIVSTGDPVVANLNVGKFFKGSAQPYIQERFVEFSVTDSSGKRSVSGRPGDLPALDMPVLNPGLQILAYRSRPQSAVYEDFAKFERFARKEGNPWIIEEHKRRGLTRRKVTEAYTRFAKSLVHAGDAPGADATVGFPLELVVEAGPSAIVAGDDVPVRLLWQDEGLPLAQLSVFQKSAGCEATRSSIYTDESGRALIAYNGGGRFLLNAVHVILPTPDTLQDVLADWESLWASTTFELPRLAAPDGATPSCESPPDGQDK